MNLVGMGYITLNATVDQHAALNMGQVQRLLKDSRLSKKRQDLCIPGPVDCAGTGEKPLALHFFHQLQSSLE